MTGTNVVTCKRRRTLTQPYHHRDFKFCRWGLEQGEEFRHIMGTWGSCDWQLLLGIFYWATKKDAAFLPKGHMVCGFSEWHIGRKMDTWGSFDGHLDRYERQSLKWQDHAVADYIQGRAMLQQDFLLFCYWLTQLSNFDTKNESEPHYTLNFMCTLWKCPSYC